MNDAHIKKSLHAIAKLDDDVAQALDQFGYPAPRIRPAGFETSLNTIVSQQIFNSGCSYYLAACQ